MHSLEPRKTLRLGALRIDQVHPYCLGEHNLQPLTQTELESIPGWSPDFPQAHSSPRPTPLLLLQTTDQMRLWLHEGSLTGVVFACVRTEDENGQPYFNLLE